jgi:hypothetical protein
MTIVGAVAETNFEVAKLKLESAKRVRAAAMSEANRATPGISRATLQAAVQAATNAVAEHYAHVYAGYLQAYAQAGSDAGAASAFGAFIRVLRKRHSDDSVLDLVKQGCATDPVFVYAMQHWKKRYVQTKQPSTVAPPAAPPMPPHIKARR